MAWTRHPELPANQVRTVYCGDAVQDERGAPALFQELQSLLPNIGALIIRMVFGAPY